MELTNLVRQFDEFNKEEQRVEEEEYKKLYEECTIKQLIDMGYCINNITFESQKRVFHGKTLLKFKYKLPTTTEQGKISLKLRRNDVVSVKTVSDLNGEAKNEVFRATLYKLKTDSLCLLIDENTPQGNRVTQNNLCIVKALDNVTYDR